MTWFLGPGHAELATFNMNGNHEVVALLRRLDRRYVIHYELDVGPYGGPVDAMLILVSSGARRVPECPSRPDTVLRADWSRVFTAMRFRVEAGRPTLAPAHIADGHDAHAAIHQLIAAATSVAELGLAVPAPSPGGRA